MSNSIVICIAVALAFDFIYWKLFNPTAMQMITVGLLVGVIAGLVASNLDHNK